MWFISLLRFKHREGKHLWCVGFTHVETFKKAKFSFPTNIQREWKKRGINEWGGVEGEGEGGGGGGRFRTELEK